MTNRELSAALSKVVRAAMSARKQLNGRNYPGCKHYVAELEQATKKVTHEMLQRQAAEIAKELEGPTTNIVRTLKETDRIIP